ncbi:MAG TPA: twin-arginine translocase TatA/TatE family subunit [Gemmataceae bacterium]|nr:twin-arginine translocase TatA/TatE family subunit [Gemmataceae bacterium]
MFGGKIGLPELAIIVFIALLIFGPKKLGDLGKGLGEGLRNFKASMSDHTASSDSNSTTKPEEKK